MPVPRYLIERTFASACDLRPDAQGRQRCGTRVVGEAGRGVTWLHSYVTPDGRRSFCVVDGPSPEAIRAAADAGGLPVDRISEIRVLDPYCLSPTFSSRKDTP
jgi:hypothetical protein